MATTLSAQELERLRQMQALGGNSGWTPQFGQTFGGMDYTPTFDTSGAQGQNASAPSLTGYIRAQEGRSSPGDPYQAFNQSGEFERDGQFKDVKGFELQFLLAAAAMGMLPGGFLSNAFGGTAGAGTMGPLLETSPEFLAQQAAFESSMAPYLSSASSVSGTMGPFAETSPEFLAEQSAFESSMAPYYTGPAAPPGSGSGPSAPPSAPPGPSNALKSVSGLLGPAATVLGAVAGAQGTPDQTQSRKMDPRLDPYVFGTGGLLDLTRGQLQKSMSPQAQAGWDQISNTGLGLLNFTPAGNGFSRFSNR